MDHSVTADTLAGLRLLAARLHGLLLADKELPCATSKFLYEALATISETERLIQDLSGEAAVGDEAPVFKVERVGILARKIHFVKYDRSK